MRRTEFDRILTSMMEAHPGVSDLLFTVGRPFQVESYGELKQVDIHPDVQRLTPTQTETLALNIIGDDRRLHQGADHDGLVRLLLRAQRPLPFPRQYLQAARQFRHRHAQAAARGALPSTAWACRRFSRTSRRKKTGSSSSPAPPAAARRRRSPRCSTRSTSPARSTS